MEIIKTEGLIIRSHNYGENSRIITLFTEDLGIISATVYGAHSKKKGLGASSRIFSWGDIILKEANGKFRADEISVREGFFPLSEDIVKLSAAVYFADLCYAAIGSNNKDTGVLRLLLNTLYAMCYNSVDANTAKTVFELRLAAEGGYLPITDRCAVCGSSLSEPSYFDIAKGGTVCSACHAPSAISLPRPCLYALRYILSAEDKRIFSFKSDGHIFKLLSVLSERYISEHLGRSFKSLEYFKKINID